MKKTIIAAMTALLLCVPVTGKIKKAKTAKANALEVSFDYQHQDGPGSNQYAVWIEDAQGQLVKTLFVTAYTTKGRVRNGEQPMRGYVKRPYCVPTWVKAAKASEQTDQQLDAITGATPRESGVQSFTWDMTDQQGKKVEAGTYRVCVEATLHDASIIIYTGTFSTQDKAGAVALTSRLTEPDENHKNMVTNVKASIR